MQESIYQRQEYKKLIQQNAYNTLEFLLMQNLDFAIVAYTNVIEFNPPIPKEIIEFDKKALFVVSGYTKESATITDTHLIIEAGFGRENFGSTLSIPLEALFQIVYNEEVLHISYHKPEPIVIKNSMEALLNNPENQKLLKKKVNKK